MNHLQRVEQEFTRRAQTFAAYAANADDQLQDRFRQALGSAAQGTILDLACGPGVVSAAVSIDAHKVVAFDVTPAMLDKALAEDGRTAAMALSIENNKLVFFHQWTIDCRDTHRAH